MIWFQRPQKSERLSFRVRFVTKRFAIKHATFSLTKLFAIKHLQEASITSLEFWMLHGAGVHSPVAPDEDPHVTLP